MESEKHLKLLGQGVEDRVTGMKGVVTSVSFDLYGCVQALVTPCATSDGSIKNDSWWMDVQRLAVRWSTPVMPVPDFAAGYVAKGKKGPADKPLPG